MKRVSGEVLMAKKPGSAASTIVKSGLTGVAMTVFAVAMGSEAGLGGMIGESIASGDARDPLAATSVSFPVPAQLTDAELVAIEGKLAGSIEAMEAVRISTDAKIAHLEMLAREAELGLRPFAPADHDANAELSSLLLRGTVGG